MPQQAETESSACGRNLFVLSLSDQEGIACYNSDSFCSTFLDFIRNSDYNIYWKSVGLLVDFKQSSAETGDEHMQYLSVTQTAEKWGISKRRIQILLSQDRVPGAMRIGCTWAIPEDAEKPKDARIKSGRYIKTKAQE